MDPHLLPYMQWFVFLLLLIMMEYINLYILHIRFLLSRERGKNEIQVQIYIDR